MSGPTSLPETTIKVTPWDSLAARNLRDAQRAEIDSLWGKEAGITPTAADISVFLVLEINGQAVACGGLRELPSESSASTTDADGKILPAASAIAEIKRMYTIPGYRGTKERVSSRILMELEDQARLRGWMVLRLETGKAMDGARRFYERHGYRQIPLFGHYIGSDISVAYEKHLTPA